MKARSGLAQFILEVELKNFAKPKFQDFQIFRTVEPQFIFKFGISNQNHMDENGAYFRAIVLDLKEKLKFLSPKEVCNQLTLLCESINNNEDVELFSFDAFEDSGQLCGVNDRL